MGGHSPIFSPNRNLTKMKSIYEWQPTRLAQGTYIVPTQTLFALFFMICICFSTTKAEYNTENIPYGLSYPEGTFDEGDVVTFTIWAGDANTTLSTVSGFDLSFSLTEHAVFPTSISPNLSGSWIAEGATLSTTTSLNETESTIHFYAADPSASQSGDGQIASFSLVCNSENVTAAQLLVNSGGGIIIQIDDFVLRSGIAPPINPLHTIEIYPNPNPSKVLLKGSSESISHWILRDLYGKELARGQQFPIDLRLIGIPRGRYFLHVHSHTAEQKGFHLLYQPQ